MAYRSFPAGSEWRRWDLHVHTPASYQCDFGEDWGEYVTALIDAINRHKIEVIATADYFTIGGYEKLSEFYDPTTRVLRHGTRSASVTLLPGVELRLDVFNDKEESINLHYVFDPKQFSPNFIRRNFLEKLSIAYRGKEVNLHDQHLLAIGRSVVTGGEPDYATEIETDHPERTTYVSNAFRVITLAQRDISTATATIKKLLGIERTSGSLISIVAGKGHGSLASLEWFERSGSMLSRAGVTRENLTNGAELLFSNSPRDREFYLGRRNDTPPAEILARFGGFKPCVWGSDSHGVENLLHPSNGASSDYTWIKADPTFEGLQQVVFEPADRVQIQEEKPNVRPDYSIIRRIRFQGVGTPPNFIVAPIELNENLNSIIGGKSSGKSILLYFIAKTIDPDQVEEKYASLKLPGYDFDADPGFDFEVEWGDGQKDKLSAGREGKRHLITYIPQMYINHLAEKPGEEKLRELIEGILAQDPEYKRTSDTIRTEIQDLVMAIGADVTLLYQQLERYKTIAAEMKAIGDKSAISANVEKLLKEIEVLRSKSGFSAQEERLYQSLQNRIERATNHGKRIDSYVLEISKHLGDLQKNKTEILRALSRQQENLKIRFAGDADALQYIAEKSSEELKEVTEAFDCILASRLDDKNKLVALVEKNESRLRILNERIGPLLSRVANQTRLQSLSQQVLAERRRLQQLGEKEIERQKAAQDGTMTRQELETRYAGLFERYQAKVSLLSDPSRQTIAEGLRLRAELQFDVTRFDGAFSSLFNRRSTNFKALFGEDSFNENAEYVFVADQHLSRIKTIFSRIWKEQTKLNFKSGVSAQDVTYKLFDDYFRVGYTIEQGGDDMLKMSPGKRGLVLLQLLLHLSNATHPILIDQPEDNLDNRTIFNELNDFIRAKKLKRQIIIVTHNANLVVSTDSEEVIVANQNGQEAKALNRTHKFEYVSGSLENTFTDNGATGILYKMGIREHVCDILEGGEAAFLKREEKYGL